MTLPLSSRSLRVTPKGPRSVQTGHRRIEHRYHLPVTGQGWSACLATDPGLCPQRLYCSGPEGRSSVQSPAPNLS
jgi:hypothetical protein